MQQTEVSTTKKHTLPPMATNIVFFVLDEEAGSKGTISALGMV